MKLVNNIEVIFKHNEILHGRKYSCRAMNLFDKMARKLGAQVSLPGGELDPKQACLQFIRFKDVLDLTLVNRDTGKYTSPFRYVEHMLPGTRFENEERSTTEEVDPATVIGCPWRQHKPPVDPLGVIDRLNSVMPTDNERASYLRIFDIPIYVAGEGKNRVELFMRHKRMIVADVRFRILTRAPKIYRGMSGMRWIASWKNEAGAHMLAAIPFPSVTLPIYKLLNIEIRDERLPVDEGELKRSYEAAIDRLTEAVAVP